MAFNIFGNLSVNYPVICTANENLAFETITLVSMFLIVIANLNLEKKGYSGIYVRNNGG